MEVKPQTWISFVVLSPTSSRWGTHYLSLLSHLNSLSVRRVFSVVSNRDKDKKRIWVEVEVGEIMRHYLILQYHLSRANNNFSYIGNEDTLCPLGSFFLCSSQYKFNQPAVHPNWAFTCDFIWAKSILKNFKASNQPKLSPLSKQIGSTASDKSLFSAFFPLLSKASFSQRRKVCHKNEGVMCIGYVWIQVWQQYFGFHWFLSC